MKNHERIASACMEPSVVDQFREVEQRAKDYAIAMRQEEINKNQSNS